MEQSAIIKPSIDFVVGRWPRLAIDVLVQSVLWDRPESVSMPVTGRECACRWVSSTTWNSWDEPDRQCQKSPWCCHLQSPHEPTKRHHSSQPHPLCHGVGPFCGAPVPGESVRVNGVCVPASALQKFVEEWQALKEGETAPLAMEEPSVFRFCENSQQLDLLRGKHPDRPL